MPKENEAGSLATTANLARRHENWKAQFWRSYNDGILIVCFGVELGDFGIQDWRLSEPRSEST